MKKPFLYALGAALYIVIIDFVAQFTSHYTASQNGTFLIPMVVLSLFTLSAAIMGFLFLSEPFYLFMDNKKKESISFFAKTVGFFACFVALFTILLFLYPMLVLR